MRPESTSVWAPLFMAASRFTAICALPLLLANPAPAQGTDPGSQTQKARELLLSGRSEEAIPLYQALVRANPRSADLLLSLSIAEFKARRFQESAQHAEAALRLNPGLAAAHLFVGASYTELRDDVRALPPLRQAVHLNPQDRNARLLLADALLRTGRYSEAASHFRAASELAPEAPRVWFGLGRSYEDWAGRELEELQASAAGSPYVHALVGESLQRQRRFGSAIREYRASLAKGITLPGVHAGIAALYRLAGQPELAAKEAARESEALSLDCTGLQCLDRPAAPRPEDRYRAYKALQQLAQEAYGRLEKLPDSAELHLYAANRLEREGQMKEAAQEWRAALHLAPQDQRIRAGMLRALFRARDYEETLALAKNMPGEERDSAEVQFLCGASLLNLERPEEAVAFLERAIAKDKGLLPAHSALGQALLRTGRHKEAIPHLKAALPVDEDGSGRFQLSRAYRLSGQTESAKQLLAEYQEFRKRAEDKKRQEEEYDAPVADLR